MKVTEMKKKLRKFLGLPNKEKHLQKYKESLNKTKKILGLNGEHKSNGSHKPQPSPQIR